ncbi:LEAF RUST 10 DISEASE-RESISTANCE LOCUS RECEPTOR-LIKE PROTEIN KINASE-like 2.5 isoform X3 [Vigna angularis]|uniref:LEAF RUST 10 DISEASE-RESISTANCE LOCUS RECEPTOR-LIKE PROTEIN KINASE-like 2.5 isoform X3 n=1 Tax=Phaseolus angularis TaxID=3914 RepID=UPI00080A42AA|nr:LEAF RUST 10 DISEASE-RESISTANCE LOCUS RECEPTOR-LIKE PROTEIN KINASE-like 2.5 isoform X3 [Vigna angularis]
MILPISFHYLKPQLCIITTIFFFATTVLSSNPKFKVCTPKSCGNGPSIKYPFWISYEQESFCGYPHFEITCMDKNPILSTPSYDFLVKDISYSNSSFTVANMAAYEDNCPVPLSNYSFDQTPFTYSSENWNLSFFYNCTTEPIDYPTYQVDCAKNASLYSFAVFHKEKLENKNYSLNECQLMVNAPFIMNASVNFTGLLRMNYIEILKMGFLLNWTAPDCEYCEKSGGRCGFDGNQFLCFCKDKTYLRSCGSGLVNWKAKIVIGTTSAATAVFMLCLIIIGCRKCMSSRRKLNFQMTNEQDIEVFLKDHGTLAQKKYRFSEVKKMTNNFTVKLGEGGFGVVYKGELSNGYHVAVKLLRASKGNGKDFINEVASISRTSHVNVVQLLGFCLEGKKKALIYEFMPNGSLDKFISNKGLERTSSLTWDNLLQIAKGIAKGLEYLHKGCNTRILHFDIKPHNILLDENFCPKISDFGLAKLCPGKESTISVSYARGTIGYVAPEVCNKHFGGVSQKSDVYSYGMMLLEIVGVRNNINVEATETSEYFPDWIYRKLEQDQDLKSDDVTATKEKETERRMIAVSLWCIQTFPKDRPTMSRVIEMLEGNMNSQEIPPKPVLSSPTIGLVPELTTSSLQSE